MTSDRGDIVLGWLTKLAVGLAALGVVGFDAVSVGSAHFTAEDHAQTAARAAGEAYRGPADLQAAYDAAWMSVLEHGDTIDPAGFSISPEGTVTLTLTRTASTMLVEKISPVRSWTVVEATVSASRPR